LTPVGFEPHEGVLTLSQRSFIGYRLLQEYFAFPEKFLFFDVTSCAKAWHECGAEEEAEMYLLCSTAGSKERQQRLELGIKPHSFRLNCTPVINLFEQTCEPIQLDQKRYEYAVVPDIRRPLASEIYSIDRVTLSARNSDELLECTPFYSPTRKRDEASHAERFWVTYRHPSNRSQDAGTDVSLALVDRSGRTVSPEDDTLTVRCTCTNRDLPAQLPFGASDNDFELDGNAPVSRIVALRKPSPALRSPDESSSLWNLISHLSLNYLSVVEDGKVALQSLLRLCDYSRGEFSRRAVEGIATIHSRPHFAGMISEHGLTFARGTKVDLELDEEQFVGGGAYLFAAVLERFFAQYCSMNSFSQLSLRTRQRREVLREWQPRGGNRILL